MSPCAPLRPCPVPQCHELTRGGRCQTHARQKEQRRPNVDVRVWYSCARWKRLRALVLAQEPLCVDCQTLDGRVCASVEVHHKVRHGGDPILFYARENLAALCHAHHSARTARGE